MQKRYFGLFPVELKFFSVAENHKWRDDVHLHTLIKTDLKATDLFYEWEHGRRRILLLNDRGAGYCAKYLQKKSDVPIDFNLRCP